MIQSDIPAPEKEILARLVGLDPQVLPTAAAKVILSLAISQTDKDRMQRLAAKASADELTSSEQGEIEAYSRIGSLLGILKSKARRALKQRQGSPKVKAN